MRAVLCEVNNTFDERQIYFCAHEDNRPITSKDVLRGEKLFHVSTLLKCEEYYMFSFDISDNKLGVWIDFFDGADKKRLVTSLVGALKPMSATF